MNTTNNITKQVTVLSHWDDGVLGVFFSVNEAKREVMYMKCETYRGFFKNKWGGWSYHGGGYEVNKMSADEAEVLFRWNEDR